MSSGYPPGVRYPYGPAGGGGSPGRREDATMPGGERSPVRLRMQLGPTIGQVYTMVGDTLTVGRAQDNDVVLDDPQVSRHHARVLHRGDQIIVEDLGSTNGTLVSGRRITGPHILQPTETIAIGSSVFSVEGFPAPTTIAMRPYRPEAVAPAPPREAAPERQTGGSPWLAMGWLGGLLIVVVLILTLAGLTAWLLTRNRVQATPTTPNVFIQSPVAGSQLPVNQPVLVNASASDPDGVTRAELWVGGNVVDQQQSAVAEGQPTFPVTLRWTPTVAGTYTLEVRAYDTQGTASPPTTVMINVVAGQAVSDTPTPALSGATATPGGPPVAVTTTDLNVREGPGESYPVLDLLPVNTQVEITGKDAGGDWWQIVYPPGTGQRAWIFAPFTRASNTENVPVIETPAPPSPTDTPTATPTTTAQPTNTPTATATATSTPTATTVAAPVVEFGATKTTVNPGECTTLQWHIENIKAAFLSGGEFSNLGITGPLGSRDVCPSATTTYILRAETSGAPVERSVTVAVRSEQTLTLNHTAGGWVRGDGAVFSPQPFVGDDNTDEALRAFFAFDLSSLADATITRAELDLGDYALTGTPLNDLGQLRVEEVDWGSTLEASDFDASVAAQLGTIEDEDDLNDTIDVTGRLRSHIDADRNSFRIRLRFETRTDDDGQNDSVNWAGRAARLVVRYYR